MIGSVQHPNSHKNNALLERPMYSSIGKVIATIFPLNEEFKDKKRITFKHEQNTISSKFTEAFDSNQHLEEQKTQIKTVKIRNSGQSTQNFNQKKKENITNSSKNNGSKRRLSQKINNLDGISGQGGHQGVQKSSKNEGNKEEIKESDYYFINLNQLNVKQAMKTRSSYINKYGCSPPVGKYYPKYDLVRRKIPSQTIGPKQWNNQYEEKSTQRQSRGSNDRSPHVKRLDLRGVNNINQAGGFKCCKYKTHESNYHKTSRTNR